MNEALEKEVRESMLKGLQDFALYLSHESVKVTFTDGAMQVSLSLCGKPYSSGAMLDCSDEHKLVRARALGYAAARIVWGTVEPLEVTAQ